MISKWPCAFHLPAVKILVLPSWSGAPNYLSGFVGEKYRLYLNEPPYIDRLSVGWEGPIPTDRWGYGQSFFLVVIRSSDWSWRQILVFFPTPSWVVYISITNTAIPLFWGGWIPSQKVKALSTFCSHTRLYSWPPRHPDVDPPNPAIAWVTLHIAHALKFILWPLGKCPLKLLYIKNIPSIGISNLGIDQVSIYSRRIYKSKTLDNNNFFAKVMRMHV